MSNGMDAGGARDGAEGPRIDDAGTRELDAEAADSRQGVKVDDAAIEDASAEDAGTADAGADEALDAAPGDSGGTDKPEPADAGGEAPCVPGVPDTNNAPPATLSATGLYLETSSKHLAAGVEPYTPSYPLWTDGADKERFVSIPACAKIDTTDMDHWAVPVGTKLWKEFRVGGLRIETRLIHRYGPGASDFSYAAYAWNEDESDATLVPQGVTNARGTQHDIPARSACLACHGRVEERVLGFSALQLSHGGPGLTMASLSEAGRLTVEAPAGFTVPGDAVAREALGYLHANCGHCHNDGPRAIQLPTPFVLRLSTADVRLETTGLMRTAVGVPLDWFYRPGVNLRIAPGAPDSSCVSYRMSVRRNYEQMPPVGSERVDPAGLASVRAFIEAL